jgi:hypothetical protein
MSASFRKTPNGSIEVFAVKDNAPVFIGRTFRLVENFRVDIAQWFDPLKRQSWFALHNPCIPLLDNMDSDEYFKYSGDYDTPDSHIVRYENTVLMSSVDVASSSEPDMYLTDLRGYYFAGSNLYGGGKLCLGDLYNPLTLQPVEHLIHNQANSDLGWRGDALEGEWTDGIFHVSPWPIIDKIVSPPAAILADIARWWPT